jgi:hypothetical protein
LPSIAGLERRWLGPDRGVGGGALAPFSRCRSQYIDLALRADEGADLDFLVGKRGAFVPKDNHQASTLLQPGRAFAGRKRPLETDSPVHACHYACVKRQLPNAGSVSRFEYGRMEPSV